MWGGTHVHVSDHLAALDAHPAVGMVDVIPADQTPHCLASVDAVILNGNTTAHLRQAREVASAHVACFVEKPLGRTEDEALVAAATLRDVPTATGFFLHHVPAVARFLELLAAPPVSASFTFGHDGRRRGVFDGDASWMVDPRSGGSGSFVDLGIHLTHLIDLIWPNTEVEVIDTEFYSATDGLSDSGGRALLHVGAAEVHVEVFAEVAFGFHVAARDDVGRLYRVDDGTLRVDDDLVVEASGPDARTALLSFLDQLVGRPNGVRPASLDEAVIAQRSVEAIRRG